MRYWKEAATVILAARFRPQKAVIPSSLSSVNVTNVQRDRRTDHLSALFDYKVLMLQRTHQSSFFAGAQVFPGGGVEEADFSPRWMELFAEAGIKTMQDFGPVVSVEQGRPDMIAADRGSPVPSDIAFRICAIRETFEESGVLLLRQLSHCRPADDHSPSVQLNPGSSHDSDIAMETKKRWRQRIHDDASEFLEMCRELKSLPDVWSLAEWSNWLTPSDMSKKRYDTMFYVCCTETLPEACQDQTETIHAEWLTPSQCLAQFLEGDFFLPPPQVYELQRLCNYPELVDLFAFNQQRALFSCQRYMPVRINCSDGVLSLLPGDYMYPDRPIVENTTKEDVRQLEGSTGENTEKHRGVHRQIFLLGGMPVCQAVCSITLPDGHCAPRPFQECINNKATSKL